MGRRYKPKAKKVLHGITKQCNAIPKYNKKVTLDMIAKEVDIMFEEDKWMWDVLKHYKDIPVGHGIFNFILPPPVILKDNIIDNIC